MFILHIMYLHNADNCALFCLFPFKPPKPILHGSFFLTNLSGYRWSTVISVKWLNIQTPSLCCLLSQFSMVKLSQFWFVKVWKWKCESESLSQFSMVKLSQFWFVFCWLPEYCLEAKKELCRSVPSSTQCSPLHPAKH